MQRSDTAALKCPRLWILSESELSQFLATPLDIKSLKPWLLKLFPEVNGLRVTDDSKCITAALCSGEDISLYPPVALQGNIEDVVCKFEAAIQQRLADLLQQLNEECRNIVLGNCNLGRSFIESYPSFLSRIGLRVIWSTWVHGSLGLPHYNELKYNRKPSAATLSHAIQRVNTLTQGPVTASSATPSLPNSASPSHSASANASRRSTVMTGAHIRRAQSHSNGSGTPSRQSPTFLVNLPTSPGMSFSIQLPNMPMPTPVLDHSKGIMYPALEAVMRVKEGTRASVRPGALDTHQRFERIGQSLFELSKLKLRPFVRKAVDVLINDFVQLMIQYNIIKSCTDPQDWEWQKYLRHYFSGQRLMCCVGVDEYEYSASLLINRIPLVQDSTTIKTFMSVINSFNYEHVPLLDLECPDTFAVEIIEDLALLTGVGVRHFDCHDIKDALQLTTAVYGVYSEGCWGILKNIDALSHPLQNVLYETKMEISKYILEKRTEIECNGRRIKFNAKAKLLFVVRSSTFKDGCALIERIKDISRLSTVPQKNILNTIVVNIAMAEFTTYDLLSKKLFTLFDLCEKNFGMVFNSGVITSFANFAGKLLAASNSKFEDIIMKDALHAFFFPRMSAKDGERFQIFLDEVFPLEATYDFHHIQLQKAIEFRLEQRKFPQSEAFVKKVTQVYESLSSNVIVIVGPPKTGKTAIRATLRESLESVLHIKYTEIVINPSYLGANALLGNFVGDSWQEGILPAFAKVGTKENRWLVCDGAINESWVNLISKLFSSCPSLSASNQEIVIPTEFKLFIETDSIKSLSPQYIAESSISVTNHRELKWEEIIDGKLLKRDASSPFTLLFRRVCLPVMKKLEQLYNICVMHCKLNPLQLSQTVCALNIYTILEGLMTDCLSSKDDSVTEMATWFAMAWGAGSLLEHSGREVVSNFVLHNFKNNIAGSIFQYRVDFATKGWKRWQDEVPLLTSGDYVQTADSISSGYIVGLVYQNTNLIVSGNRGGGKSAFITNLLKEKAASSIQLYNIGASPNTTVESFATAIIQQTNVTDVVTPKNAKKLFIYVENANYIRKTVTYVDEYLLTLMNNKLFFMDSSLKYKELKETYFILEGSSSVGELPDIGARLASCGFALRMPFYSEPSLRSIISYLFQRGISKSTASGLNNFITTLASIYSTFTTELQSAGDESFSFCNVMRSIRGFCLQSEQVTDSLVRLTKTNITDVCLSMFKRETELSLNNLESQKIVNAIMKFTSHEQLSEFKETLLLSTRIDSYAFTYTYCNSFADLKDRLNVTIQEVSNALRTKIVLHPAMASPLLKVLRAFSLANSHGIIVGESGSGRRVLYYLASTVLNYDMSVTKQVEQALLNNSRVEFIASLKQAYNLATAGKLVSVLLPPYTPLEWIHDVQNLVTTGSLIEVSGSANKEPLGKLKICFIVNEQRLSLLNAECPGLITHSTLVKTNPLDREGVEVIIGETLCNLSGNTSSRAGLVKLISNLVTKIQTEFMKQMSLANNPTSFKLSNLLELIATFNKIYEAKKIEIFDRINKLDNYINILNAFMRLKEENKSEVAAGESLSAPQDKEDADEDEESKAIRNAVTIIHATSQDELARVNKMKEWMKDSLSTLPLDSLTICTVNYALRYGQSVRDIIYQYLSGVSKDPPENHEALGVSLSCADINAVILFLYPMEYLPRLAKLTQFTVVDPITKANVFFAMKKVSPTLPLVIESSLRLFEKTMVKYFDKDIVKVDYALFVEQIPTYIERGNKLLVTDVDARTPNQMMCTLINALREESGSRQITLKGKTYDIHPAFSIKLTTTDTQICEEFDSRCNIIRFDFDREGKCLESYITHHFLQREKQIEFIQDTMKLSTEIIEAEKNSSSTFQSVLPSLIARLFKTTNIPQDFNPANHHLKAEDLLEFQNLMHKIKQTQSDFTDKKAQIGEMFKRQSSLAKDFQNVGAKCNLIYKVCGECVPLNPLFNIPFPIYLQLVTGAAGKGLPNALPSRRSSEMEDNIQNNVLRYIFRNVASEQSKLVFSFKLSLLIELSGNTVDYWTIWAALRGAALYSPWEKETEKEAQITVDETGGETGGNPLNAWLPDRCWANALILSSKFPTFKTLSDSLVKKEKQWKEWWAGWRHDKKIPEFEKLTRIEKFILVRFLKEDKTLIAVQQFVKAVLGDKIHIETDNHWDIVKSLINESNNKTPVVLILPKGLDVYDELLNMTSKNTKTKKKDTKDLSSTTVKLDSIESCTAAATLQQQCITNGWWLVLRECDQKGTPYLRDLGKWFSAINEQVKDDVHADYRCWVITHEFESLPLELLEISTVVRVPLPTGIKQRMMMNVGLISNSSFISLPSVEWRSALYGAMFYLSVIHERLECGSVGIKGYKKYLINNHSYVDCSAVLNLFQQLTGRETRISLLSPRSAGTSQQDAKVGQGSNTPSSRSTPATPNRPMSANSDTSARSARGRQTSEVIANNKQLSVPWETIREMISSVLLGGGIEDDGVLVLKYFAEYIINPDVLHPSTMVFSGYSVPSLDSVSTMLAEISSNFPLTDKLTSLGLHTNLEIVLNEQKYNEILTHSMNMILESPMASHKFVHNLQKNVGGASQVSALQYILKLSSMVPEVMSKQFVESNVTQQTATFRFLQQEISNYNAIIVKVKDDLDRCYEYISQEFSNIDPRVVRTCNTILFCLTPLDWELQGGWYSETTAQWIDVLRQRQQQYLAWVSKGGLLPTVWLGGFFDVKEFIVALKEEAVVTHANDEEWAFDQLEIQTELLDIEGDIDIQWSLPNSVFVKNLFAFGIEYANRKIVETFDVSNEYKGTVNTLLPCLLLSVVTKKHLSQCSNGNWFRAPVYTNSKREDILFYLNMLCDECPMHWLLRGAAVFTQK